MRPLALLAALPACLAAAQVDYGYWDVTLTRSWAANGYKGWAVAANYSATPGATKHSSWDYLPPPGNGSFSEKTSQDVNFNSTIIIGSGSCQVNIAETVVLPDISPVDLAGVGTIDCHMHAAGRSCSGSGRINATCVSGQCS